MDAVVPWSLLAARAADGCFEPVRAAHHENSETHNKNQGVWEVILVTFPKKSPFGMASAVTSCPAQEGTNQDRRRFFFF
jgi:hypothetical protein